MRLIKILSIWQFQTEFSFAIKVTIDKVKIYVVMMKVIGFRLSSKIIRYVHYVSKISALNYFI